MTKTPDPTEKSQPVTPSTPTAQTPLIDIHKKLFVPIPGLRIIQAMHITQTQNIKALFTFIKLIFTSIFSEEIVITKQEALQAFEEEAAKKPPSQERLALLAKIVLFHSKKEWDAEKIQKRNINLSSINTNEENRILKIFDDLDKINKVLQKQHEAGDSKEGSPIYEEVIATTQALCTDWQTAFLKEQRTTDREYVNQYCTKFKIEKKEIDESTLTEDAEPSEEQVYTPIIVSAIERWGRGNRKAQE